MPGTPREGDGRPVSSTWRTFLAGHANELWTMDLTTQPLWDYSVRYVLVLMELRSRRVVHVAVTASPTLAWLKQRIRAATPYGSGPRFLVHYMTMMGSSANSGGVGPVSPESRIEVPWTCGSERSCTSKECRSRTVPPTQQPTSSGSWEA